MKDRWEDQRKASSDAMMKINVVFWTFLSVETNQLLKTALYA